MTLANFSRKCSKIATQTINSSRSVKLRCGRGSLVVKVSDRGWLVTISSPIPRKISRVGERCSLNLSRPQTFSRWCDVVFRRGGASSDIVLFTRPWFKITRSFAKSRAAEQGDVNIHSLAETAPVLLRWLKRMSFCLRLDLTLRSCIFRH
ncbi:uncharacterized protein TNCV_72951 [Trichonephila clavipes]|uniref:Uncharacterized protein n=1 Tax=Trichonephila clavipes TaxID=2585209 RepID=A0A8X6RBR7_TRICX|nr:uncharacterized protein TNCV_72951 [Trichonephila clavipes]